MNESNDPTTDVFNEAESIAPKDKTHCGFVAIIGRPNVGKSTLINCLVSRKISITSQKPQTTRHQVLGVRTEGDKQLVLVDTPGIHLNYKKLLNRAINKAATSALVDVDCVLFVVESMRWTQEDSHVLKLLEKKEVPVILVINKVDVLGEKEHLLPYIEMVSHKHPFREIVPISALKQQNVKPLINSVWPYLPEGPFHFSPDQISNQGDAFWVAECVREKIMRVVGEEVPYATTVLLEHMEKTEKLVTLHALVLVERDSQKPIIIGRGGLRLKKIGKLARLELESYFGQKVMLKVWVKVKDSWTNDKTALAQLGFDA